MTLRLGRRGFLAMLAGVAGAVALGVHRWRSAEALLEEDATIIVSLFPHDESAAILGRLYLANIREEADLARLMPLIRDALGSTEISPASTDSATLRTALASRIQKEFSNGDVVSVDGWLLSITEARVCAVASLVP